MGEIEEGSVSQWLCYFLEVDAEVVERVLDLLSATVSQVNHVISVQYLWWLLSLQIWKSHTSTVKIFILRCCSIRFCLVIQNEIMVYIKLMR